VQRVSVLDDAAGAKRVGLARRCVGVCKHLAAKDQPLLRDSDTRLLRQLLAEGRQRRLRAQRARRRER
jgi:hypothetical protein